MTYCLLKHKRNFNLTPGVEFETWVWRNVAKLRSSRMWQHEFRREV